MTKRLEEALKRLTPEQIEHLTSYVEGLALRAGGPRPGEPPQFKWVGCMRDGPERSSPSQQ